MKKIIAAFLLGLALAATPAFPDDEVAQEALPIVTQIVADDQGNTYFLFDEENMQRLNEYVESLRRKAEACSL